LIFFFVGGRIGFVEEFEEVIPFGKTNSADLGGSSDYSN